MDTAGQEIGDIGSLIRETWKSKKETMPEELGKGDGLTGTFMRILATSEKVRETLLEGKSNFPNRALHATLIGSIRTSLGLEKKGGTKNLLTYLGVNESQVGKWEKINRDHHGFTSGKNSIECTGMDFSSSYRGGNSKLMTKV